MKARTSAAALALSLVFGTACADTTPTEVSGWEALEEPSLASSAHAGLTLSDLTIPLTTATGSGSFLGDLTITNVALNNAGDLVVSGTLTGLLDIGGVVTQLTDFAFTTVATLSNAGRQKCDILHLDLGPLFIDLLGLEIDLSQITLDIDAIPGSGNLLGNLLCAVAGLLDGNPALLDVVEMIVAEINDLLKDVVGNLPLGTVQGTVTDISGLVPGATSFVGTAEITGIRLTRAGDLVVTGTLTGDILDATGGVLRTVTDFAFETTAALTQGGQAGVCDILFLELGPLHLDLLGLVVDLSQITLDIDAVPGPGNLLGNLLCAVAGLLDPGGSLSDVLQDLLDVINQLLGSL